MEIRTLIVGAALLAIPATTFADVDCKR